MSDAGRTVEVYADWLGLGSAARLGTLSVQAPRGKEVFSFEYDLAWLRRDDNRTPDPDLRELWKRIVFSIAVSNTDDHLRNHGFLLDAKGLAALARLRHQSLAGFCGPLPRH